MIKIKFKKGDRVRAVSYLSQTATWVDNPRDHIHGGGRWSYFDVPMGSEGTLIGSSASSGPTYKNVCWDFNHLVSEVHKSNIELVVDDPLT